MKDVRSLVIPVVFIIGWFGMALATMVQLAHMGATLTEVDQAEQARQAALHAPRVASVPPRSSAQ